MADGYGKTPIPAEALQWLKWKEEEGKKFCTIETRTHCQKNNVEEQHMMEGQAQTPTAQNEIQLEENIKGNQEKLGNALDVITG